VAQFELSKGSDSQYRWRLKSANGQISATGGEGYTTKASVENGIVAAKRDALSATTDDLT
jgi:uncharacterized protein YegP (UPF0339 family)